MKFLAIDANSIVNRSFYGVRPLTTSSGLPTNAVFGLYKMLLKAIRETEPDYIAAAWDLKAPTFRHQQYSGYKATRHGMPNELAVQLPYLHRLIQAMGIPELSCEGFEADDILGTLSRICEQEKVQCIIMTGDRDSFQLVGPLTVVRLATNKDTVVYDQTKIQQDYHLLPAALIHVKALMGDASDNIPGVKGVGEKTALALIQRYGTIEAVFENLDHLDGVPSRAKKCLAAQDAEPMAKMSKLLGTIRKDVPVPETLSTYRRTQVDNNAMLALFDELEFKSMAKLYQPEDLPTSAEKTSLPSPTKKEAAFEQVTKLLEQEPVLDFFMQDDALYVFAGKETFEFSQDPWAAFCACIVPSRLPKRTTHVKELYRRCLSKGVELSNVTFSCDLAAYLLDASGRDYSLETLRNQYLKQRLLPNCFSELCDLLQRKLEEQGMTRLAQDIELPLANVLAYMEQAGCAIDKAALKEFGDNLQFDVNQLTQSIFEMAGEPFNLNSPKELGYILFDKLGLPPGKKTKLGYSTNADVLQKLMKHHPIAQSLLSFRTLSKLKSTYADGFLKEIHPDGRIHTVFKQTETRTGRISSAEPNMQNIPVRTDRGRLMRKFFVAKPGYLLLDADYSQIELRVLAHLSQDQKMIRSFLDGKDIHAATAGEVFGFAPEFVPAELRRRAKTINFGIVYGMGAFSLAQDLHVSTKEAHDYIQAYFNTYPGVKQYMDRVVEQARQTGKVSTMFGRVRYIPEINYKNHNLRALGERIARNTPTQGTAADIIKIAMVRVHSRLLEEKLDAQLILQVHDELLIEASEKDADQAAALLKQEMESAAEMDVPLTVDVGRGRTWYDAKS